MKRCLFYEKKENKINKENKLEKKKMKRVGRWQSAWVFGGAEAIRAAS